MTKYTLKNFAVTLVPCTCSPVIREMFRQRKTFKAQNLREAKALVNKAYPDGADLSGEWFVESVNQEGEGETQA
jgi:hypothetical protein